MVSRCDGGKIKMRRIQEDRKTSRKSNKDNKFSPLKCYSRKTDIWNEYTKTKAKGLHHASENILSICKRQDCLSENAPHKL